MPMQVVLLERVEKLGQMGDVVSVKPGFARNYLLPRGKALRATKDNIARFERERAQLEARNLELKKEAEAVATRLNGQTYVIIRQAGEAGQLYGSVSPRDVAEAATNEGVTIDRNQVVLDRPIKTIGMHPVRISLHPEVNVTVTVNVARTQEEAVLQARGERVIGREEALDDEPLDEDAERFFEEGAAEADEADVEDTAEG